MTVKLVIFDMDGVLLNSEPIVFPAVSKAFASHGREITIQAFRKAQGLPLPGFCTAIDPSVTGPEAKQIGDEVVAYILANLSRVKTFQDTKKTLEQLSKKGLKLAVVSGTPNEHIGKELGIVNIRTYFDFVLGGGLLKRGKPYPDQFIHVCTKLAVAPADTLAVGDTRNDLLAAKAAGCRTVVMNREKEKFADLKPDYFITTLSQILDLV